MSKRALVVLLIALTVGSIVGLIVNCYNRSQQKHSFFDNYFSNAQPHITRRRPVHEDNAIYTNVVNSLTTAANWFRHNEETQDIFVAALCLFVSWWLLNTVVHIMVVLLWPMIIAASLMMAVSYLRERMTDDQWPDLRRLIRNGFLRMADFIDAGSR